MATSGSITKTVAFGNIKMTVTRTSVDITNNCSYWTASLTRYASSNIASSANKASSMTVNGSTVWSGNVTIGGGGTKTLKTVTGIKIPHNGDGSKTFSFSFSQKIEITWGSTWVGTVSGSGNVTCDTIPRASSFGSISGNTIGNTLSFSINRASSAFTHEIWYHINGQGWQVATRNAATNFSFTLPMALCDYLPGSTSGTLSLNLVTMNGTTQIGNVSTSLTVYVPGSVLPNISSIGISEAISNIASVFGCYVKNKSTLNVNVNATGAYGSTIRSYSTSIQGTAYTSAAFRSNILSTSGSIAITTTVTDTRGRTTTKSTNITVFDYFNPQPTSLTVQRCLANGTVNDDGAYIRCTYSYNIAPVNNRNSKSIKIQWLNGTTWSDLYSTDDSYSASNKVYISTNQFDANKAFEIRLYVGDYFTSGTIQKTLPTVFTLMNYNASGHGIGIGQVSTKDAFEVSLPVQFNSQILGQLAKSNAATSWYLGRNTAFIRNTVGSSTGWCSLASMKTPIGSWEMGTLGEDLYFSYVKDSDFNAGTNASVTVGIQPSKNIIATMTWANITGKPSTFSPSNHSHSYATWLGAQYASGGEWLGFYNKYGGTRKGWIGHDGTNVLRITNEAGSTVYINCDMQIPNGSKLWSKNTSGSSTYLAVMGTNNVAYFGDNSYQNCLRGTKVYLGSSGATVTSDRNLKYDIEPIKDEYVELFKKLKPINYKYINGGAKRPHIGFIAQDIEDSLKEIGMTSNDFAGLCIDEASSDGDEDSGWDGNYLVKNGFSKMYTLVYEEFIALNTHMIQKIYKKVDDQQNEIDNLKNEIDELKKTIKKLL